MNQSGLDRFFDITNHRNFVGWGQRLEYAVDSLPDLKILVTLNEDVEELKLIFDV